MIESVEYWKEKGLEIDFLPYRFYKIGDELYFEFFDKSYDYHVNPKDAKTIIFDTNKSYDPDAIWDMFDKDKISTYGSSTRYIEYFNKGDYALYYHKGYGVVGAGIVSSSMSCTDTNNNELYRTVNLLTPKICTKADIYCISPSELTSLVDKNFYFSSTAKSPYVNVEEAK